MKRKIFKMFLVGLVVVILIVPSPAFAGVGCWLPVSSYAETVEVELRTEYWRPCQNPEHVCVVFQTSTGPIGNCKAPEAGDKVIIEYQP